MSTPSILVVEDDWFLASELTTTLRAADMDVVGPVGTVSKALAAIEAAEIDAAFLDINLHGDSGFVVAAALRAKSIPFAFVSGYTLNSVPNDFREAPYLGKPIAANKIISIARELLAHKAEG